MLGMLGDILMVVLAAAFAIGAIIFIFAVSSHYLNEIVEAFQRGFPRGVGMLGAVLAAAVYGVRLALPHVIEFYRWIVS